jgi:DNA-directed RNA polymerase
MTHIYLDPKADTQGHLEVHMFDLGKEKFLSRLRKEQERGQAAAAGATSRILDMIYPPMTEMLNAWKAEIAAGGVGRNPAAYAPLKDIEPELVTYIGLRVIFDLIMSRGGCTEHKAALTIGTWVEHECRLRAFQKKNKRYLDKLMEAARKRSNNAVYLRTVTVNAMNKKADNWTSWKHNTHVAVGFVVIQCLLDCGGFIERDTSQSEVKLYPTDDLIKMINQQNDALMEITPTVLPCIEKPLPWSTPYDGGYHTEMMRERYCLLTAFHKKERLKLLEKADMPAVYRAINAVQSTGWR